MTHPLDDPTFTGSSSQYVPAEVLQVKMPFRIAISCIDNYNNGRRVSTYYNWDVELLNQRVCYRDIYKNPPRTRKAAISQARKAIKNYVEFQLQMIHR